MLILLARIDQELNPGGDDLRRVLRNVAWCMRPQNVCEEGFEADTSRRSQILAAVLYLRCIILFCQNLTAMVQNLS